MKAYCFKQNGEPSKLDVVEAEILSALREVHIELDGSTSGVALFAMFGMIAIVDGNGEATAESWGMAFNVMTDKSVKMRNLLTPILKRFLIEEYQFEWWWTR